MFIFDLEMVLWSVVVDIESYIVGFLGSRSKSKNQNKLTF